MRVKRAFQMAIKSLLASKMRALLTMLGIIIGISSVIIIVSLVNGFSSSMTDTFESMGTNTTTAMITHPLYQSKIDEDDVYDFVLENNETLGAVSPQINVSATLKNGEATTESSGMGVSEEFFTIKDLAVQSGTSLNYINVKNAENVIVIGSYNATELFGSPQMAIGQKLKLNGQNFTVVGVLEQTSDNTEASDDDTYYIPYSTAERLGNQTSTYIFASTTTDNALEAKELVNQFFIDEFGSEDYHRLIAMEEMLDQVNELTGMITLMLGGIASISLLVGGIGIMNIMLVSVSERTREIGIRKSLGGKRKDILTQFLIESGVTSSIGGIIGVVFGIAVSFIAGELLGMTAVVSIDSVILSFGISVAIGICFGFFPAQKASKLNPIDALRFD